MNAAEYKHGEMDITDQAMTWKGFMTATQWSSFIIVLVIGYATFTLATGMNWLVALVLCAGVGVVGGLLMGMGGAWIATVVALSALAVFVQLLITLSQALM
ncbi:MAG: aa3-type cytochrome c oxidase subunit IV [Pseudomonadota bacterium]